MTHLISLGAGVQSSAMALLAAAGEITPMPTAAIFADTQAEPAGVYSWLDWLETKLPFPVYRVTAGNLTAAQLRLRVRTKSVGLPYVQSIIPAFIKNKDGSRGILGRACTADYKVKPIMKAARKIGAVKRGEKSVKVTQWIGISLDEVRRMRPSRDAWAENRWPLIEKEMSRHDCLNWMQRNGYPKPPRSACVYCPFHTDNEWRRMKNEEPVEFSRAVQFERDLQAVKAMTDSMEGVPFLNSALRALNQIEFFTDAQRGQATFLDDPQDCMGMCGL